MAETLVVGAQLATSHLAGGPADLRRILQRVDEIAQLLPLDLLIAGPREVPDLFRALTSPPSRPARRVYLWYDLLSDYPGLSPADLVANYRGASGSGWDGWATHATGVSETFRFGCASNPVVRRKTLAALERLLTSYSFDGVFLDKLRYPSPANGLDGLFSCFCPHCRRAAMAQGLDLAEAAAALAHPAAAGRNGPAITLPPGAPWLEALLSRQPALQRFVRFRAAVVTDLVAAAHAVAGCLGKTVALDLFSPGLAPLVGQDYPALAHYAAWGKPMTYGLANGPAGFRLEIPALARGLAEHLARDPDDLLRLGSAYVAGLQATDLARLEAEGAPLELMAHEMRAAVALLSPAPAYLGLETVSYPGVIDIDPGRIQGMMAAARAAGAPGLILSWDLLHTPLENVRAVAAAL